MHSKTQCFFSSLKIELTRWGDSNLQAEKCTTASAGTIKTQYQQFLWLLYETVHSEEKNPVNFYLILWKKQVMHKEANWWSKATFTPPSATHVQVTTSSLCNRAYIHVSGFCVHSSQQRFWGQFLGSTHKTCSYRKWLTLTSCNSVNKFIFEQIGSFLSHLNMSLL